MLEGMERRLGFTLIELLVTLTVIVILILLTAVNLRSTEASARDEERKTDVDNIARGLEQRYANGNRRATASYVAKGAYPGTNEILHAQGVLRSDFTPTQIVGGYMTDLLSDTSPSNFIAPGSTANSFMVSCDWSSPCQPAETQSVIDTATTTATYIYEPIDKSGNVCCCGDCVRYNLYYRTEKDSALHKVMSKNQ